MVPRDANNEEVWLFYDQNHSPSFLAFLIPLLILTWNCFVSVAAIKKDDTVFIRYKLYYECLRIASPLQYD